MHSWKSLCPNAYYIGLHRIQSSLYRDFSGLASKTWSWPSPQKTRQNVDWKKEWKGAKNGNERLKSPSAISPKERKTLFKKKFSFKTSWGKPQSGRGKDFYEKSCWPNQHVIIFKWFPLGDKIRERKVHSNTFCSSLPLLKIRSLGVSPPLQDQWSDQLIVSGLIMSHWRSHKKVPLLL